MYTVEMSPEFDKWLLKLKDLRAKMRILTRIKKIELGLLGDFKILSGKLAEIRLTYGPGYRLYFTERDGKIILLLCGGDKSTQSRDIKKAKSLLLSLEDQNENKKI